LGDTVTFTVTLDVGTSGKTLQDVEMLAELPAGMTFVDGGVSVNGVPAPEINPGVFSTYPDVTSANYTVTVQAKVTAPPPSENAAAGFAISYTMQDPDTGTIAVSQVIPVALSIDGAPTIDLTLNKTASAAQVSPGDEITFTVTVTNAGPWQISAFTLTDAVPAEIVSPQFSTDGGAAWAAWTGSYIHSAPMQVGDAVAVLIKGTVDSATSASAVTNTAVLASAELPLTFPDQNTASATAAIARTAALKIVKRSDKALYTAGDQVVYTLTVSNAGPHTSIPQIDDALPAEIANAEYAYQGTSAPWTGQLTLNALPVNQSDTVTVTGTVGADAFSNLASVTHS
jgi:uncharacterized repeat protein (TIGR01451 family)